MRRFIIVVSLFCFSCSKVLGPKVSDDVMVQVLVDLSIATEKASMAKISVDTANMYVLNVYKPEVLAKYGVDEKDFDDVYMEFSNSPEKMLIIQARISDSLRAKHLKGRLDF